MMGWADLIDDACEAFFEQYEFAARHIIHGTCSAVIDNSVVGNPALWDRPAPKDYVPGRFRSNWRLGVDAIDITLTTATNIHEVNGLAEIPADPTGHRYFVSNASPQAFRLEFDGWSSKQAPGGIIGPTELQFTGIIADGIAAAKNPSLGGAR